MTINFKDIHLGNYLSTNFWFNVDRIGVHLVDWTFLAIGVALVALAIIAKLFSIYIKHPVTKKPLNRMFKVFLSTGLVEAVWFGFRYQNANVIGTHTLAVLILIVGFLYFIPIVKYYFKAYRKERDDWDKEQLKLKYLRA